MDTVRPRTVAAVLSPYAAGTHRDERDRAAKLEEAVGLARAIDLDVRVAETVPLRRVTPATLIGKGVVERMKANVEEQGIVTWFDNFSVLLRRDGHSQLVYKHAISTIMPVTPVQLFDGDKAEG